MAPWMQGHHVPSMRRAGQVLLYLHLSLQGHCPTVPHLFRWTSVSRASGVSCPAAWYLKRLARAVFLSLIRDRDDTADASPPLQLYSTQSGTRTPASESPLGKGGWPRPPELGEGESHLYPPPAGSPLYSGRHPGAAAEPCRFLFRGLYLICSDQHGKLRLFMESVQAGCLLGMPASQ